MDKVNIKEIAQELGSSSSIVLEKAIQMSINVKSIRSSVTLDDAQQIFDAIMYNQEQQKRVVQNQEEQESEYNSFYKRGKLYITFTNKNIDLNFNKHIIDTFENDAIDNFLLFSYSNNDEKLKYNFKEFHDDFDIGTVDDNKPLEKLEYYSKRYNPQAILIDGIEYKYLDENFKKIFDIIKKILVYKIKCNFSIVNISKLKQEQFIAKVNKFFSF